MNPALIPLILGLVELLVKEAPAVAAELQALFGSKKEPTAEDWALLRARVLAASFEKLAPDAKTD